MRGVNRHGACIAAGLHPDTVTWQRPDSGNSLFGNASMQLADSETARRPGAKLTVPRSFLALAEMACCIHLQTYLISSTVCWCV